jgi:hypothetical protein
MIVPTFVKFKTDVDYKYGTTEKYISDITYKPPISKWWELCLNKFDFGKMYISVKMFP